MSFSWRSLVIGLAGGFFGSMVGLGGAVIIIPLLTGWAKVSQHKAHATSLVAVVFTGLIGAAAYAGGGALDWGIAVPVAIAAVITSTVAAAYSSRVPAGLLKRIFGGLLVAAALVLILGFEISGQGIGGAWRLPAAVVLGLMSGTLTGLLGIGGGAFVVPLLVFAFGLDQHLAQGTSLAVMIPAGIAGTVVHATNRRIDLRLVVGLIIGVAIGAFGGGKLALLTPERPLQIIFGIILLWTGARYLRPTPKASKAN
ncbi:MAG TPA: sulfite exporter TauE/SafE family protein [Trueperaceae bacterium]|nr:sulfite exporter TauE/SafE family protein [Trueperaceae bacterium]HRQ11269.1 sulfite exporter TauE/SafE family protein [Trueperaceae bacterium]